MAGTSGSQSLALNIQRRGWSWLDSGVQGPNVAAPGNRRSQFNVQEQPYHPKPFLWGGRFPDAVANTSQIKTSAFNVQEQPYHPKPSTWPGLRPDNSANFVQIKSFTVNVQEQPFHPRPFVFNFTPVLVRPVVRFVITRQEQPRHPGPVFGQPPRSASFGPEVIRYIVTRQEQPWQPLWPRPPVQAGIPTNSEFCFGMILGN